MKGTSNASNNAKNIDAFRDGDFKDAIALNAGPSTPIKDYGGNMRFEKDFGAGRIKNVRPKPGLNLKDVTGY